MSVDIIYPTFATGARVGAGVAINVSLGWVPDFVAIYNVTDGTRIHEGFVGTIGRRMVFTSGGPTEVVAGDTLRGDTNKGVQAIIQGVVLTSGTWAAGNAAGSFFFNPADETGTFGSENVSLFRNGRLIQADVATVVPQIEDTVDIDTEVASATGNAAIRSYLGTSTLARGFTIGSTIAVSGKVLRYAAWRGAPV